MINITKGVAAIIFYLMAVPFLWMVWLNIQFAKGFRDIGNYFDDAVHKNSSL